MKKQLNKELLNEELKKFRLLSEYDFYQEKKEQLEFKDLLLGNDLEEGDEEPNDLQPADDTASDDTEATDAVAADLGVEPAEEPMDEPMDEPAEDEMGGEPADDEMGGEPIAEPASDDVEVDVTELVQGSEEAKNSADEASRNSQILMQKLSDLESHVAKMDIIGNKIEDLEKEIIKRNPTPVEKLEMRSLDSYPFNQKLSDYWSEKEGPYDVMNKGNEKKEYVLTKKDIDDNYTDSDIKKSFAIPNEYDEEDINDYTEEDM